MSLADAYATVILDHNRHPRRRGRLRDPTISAVGVNALCGDRLQFDLRIADQCLLDFAFEGEASALTLAAASIMGDLVCGRDLQSVQALSRAALELVTNNPARLRNPALGQFNHFIGVLGFPNRIKTVTLPWATLLGALDGRGHTSTDVDVRGALPEGRKKHE